MVSNNFSLQSVVLCLISLASASVPSRLPSYGSPEATYEARPQPYSFNYDVKDEYGNILNRQEIGDELGNKKGSYGYIDTYGISRQVDYIADDKGFRALVKTNEPGTDNQNPADVEILSSSAPIQSSSAYGSPSVPAYSRQIPVQRPASVPVLSGKPGTAIYDNGASLIRQPIRQLSLVPVQSRVLPNLYNPGGKQPSVSLSTAKLY